MDNEELKKKWPALKTRLKQEHPGLTDEELDAEPGNEAEQLLRIQKKLGKTDKEIHNWLSLMG